MEFRKNSDQMTGHGHVPWGLSLNYFKYTLWIVLLTSLALVPVTYALCPDQPLRILGPLLETFIAAFSIVLVRRGKILSALRALIWATWIVVTGILFLYGGVRGTLVVVFPMFIILCGWFLGLRQAIILSSISASAIAAMTLAGEFQLLPSAQMPRDSVYGIIQLICIGLSCLLIFFLVTSYRTRLNEAETLRRDLKSRTTELEAITADLNTAQSIASTGSWVYDFVTDKIFMSKETRRIFDVPEEMSGTREGYLRLVHRDDLKKMEESFRQAFNGKPLFNEHRIRIGKEVRWICQRGRVESDPSGKPIRCVGTAQDITAIKQAEEEIRIAAIAFESQEGMVVTDSEARILRINQAFTRITGYEADEIIGKNPRILKSGRHDADFYLSMWDQTLSTGSWQGEIWNRRKNGEIYPEWLTITAVKDQEGNISHFVGTLTDITQRKASEDEIRNLAFYDPLTGLPNRRLLLDRIQQALALSARSDRQGALLFLDLDHFKTLNDTLGHDKGDLLLQQVAQRLSTCIREGDTVSRLGGDEFVIMLSELSTVEQETTAQADTVAQKVLRSLSEPYNLESHIYRSTASIGITLFSDHKKSPRDLLKQADLAMYHAKSSGRNRCCFFSRDMQSHPEENRIVIDDPDSHRSGRLRNGEMK